MNAIDQAVANFKQSLQLIFVVLPKNTLDIYSAVKKRCCVDYGGKFTDICIKCIRSPTHYKFNYFFVMEHQLFTL